MRHNAIFIVWQMQERFLAKKQEVWMAFVDLEKAFGFPREMVWWALTKFWVDEWLVKIIQAMHEGVSTAVKLGEGEMLHFRWELGLFTCLKRRNVVSFRGFALCSFRGFTPCSQTRGFSSGPHWAKAPRHHIDSCSSARHDCHVLRLTFLTLHFYFASAAAAWFRAAWCAG